jgi:hypothetical protein
MKFSILSVALLGGRACLLMMVADRRGDASERRSGADF